MLVLPHKGEASDYQEPVVVADPAAVLGLGLCRVRDKDWKGLLSV